MGDSQETFEAILGFLHREFVDPNYLQHQIEVNEDGKFKLNNELDSMGCTPKCAAHQTFGIETTDLTSCSLCHTVDDVASTKTEFQHQYYVAEMVKVHKRLRGKDKNLPEVLRTMIKEEADFRMEHREKKFCRKCNVALKLEDRWLLELPNIYTLGLQYPDVNMTFSRDEVKQIFDLLQPKLCLSKFMKVSADKTNDLFVMRGLIVYYGKHYWAYFYSEKFDGWF
jgi:hypothetical protein